MQGIYGLHSSVPRENMTQLPLACPGVSRSSSLLKLLLLQSAKRMQRLGLKPGFERVSPILRRPVQSTIGNANGIYHALSRHKFMFLFGFMLCKNNTSSPPQQEKLIFLDIPFVAKNDPPVSTKIRLWAYFGV